MLLRNSRAGISSPACSGFPIPALTTRHVFENRILYWILISDMQSSTPVAVPLAGMTSLNRRAPDWEHLNYGVEFAPCPSPVRLVGLALMNVQFRSDVLLNKGAQVATAIRQLDGAADLRLQVVQGRRSVQGCDYLLQLVPELRQLFSSQRGVVARMEHTCPSGLELDLACQPVRVGTAPLVGPFVSADPQRESASVPRHCCLHHHVHEGSRRKAMALHLPGSGGRLSK